MKKSTKNTLKLIGGYLVLAITLIVAMLWLELIAHQWFYIMPEKTKTFGNAILGVFCILFGSGLFTLLGSMALKETKEAIARQISWQN